MSESQTTPSFMEIIEILVLLLHPRVEPKLLPRTLNPHVYYRHFTPQSHGRNNTGTPNNRQNQNSEDIKSNNTQCFGSADDKLDHCEMICVVVILVITVAIVIWAFKCFLKNKPCTTKQGIVTYRTPFPKEYNVVAQQDCQQARCKNISMIRDSETCHATSKHHIGDFHPQAFHQVKKYRWVKANLHNEITH